MSELTQLLHTLVRGNRENIAPTGQPIRLAQEMSLLETLQEAKTRGLKSSGGTSGGRKIPINATAHDIEADMIRTIHHLAPVHERYTLASMPLPQRLETWAHVVGEAVAIDWCRYWLEAIRSLDTDVSYKTGACPMCGEAKYREGREDGVIIKDTIQTSVRYTPHGATCAAECLSCKAYWAGLEEVEGMAAAMRSDIAYYAPQNSV